MVELCDGPLKVLVDLRDAGGEDLPLGGEDLPLDRLEDTGRIIFARTRMRKLIEIVADCRTSELVGVYIAIWG